MSDAGVRALEKHASQLPGLPIEILPKSILCIPLVIQWLWLALRYRSLTLPSCTNPCIEIGGLVGESKFSCLQLIGGAGHDSVAETAIVNPGDDAELVRQRVALSFPLIAKPDIGWCGYGVRRIDNSAELAIYARSFPKGASFLLQRFIDQPYEAGLFYMRNAEAEEGHLIGMTIRHEPHVVGDGISTVTALIAQAPRMRHKSHLYSTCLNEEELQATPVAGEYRRLTIVASLRMGARYEDATSLITPALDKKMDEICRSMGEFHFGRFDVKFSALTELQLGSFTIMEVNGAGSEAIQFWDPSLTLWQSFKGVFAKQRELFALGDSMRRAGHKPVGWRKLLAAHLRQQKLIGNYPASN